MNRILITILYCSTLLFSQSALKDFLPLEKESLLRTLLEQKEKYKIQIIYTQINRGKNNSAAFNTYTFNLNNEKYWYPASTVKLPAAVFAFEKLNDLNKQGLNKYSPLEIDSAYPGQTRVLWDSTSENRRPSLAHYAKKVFLVSDNDAHNRLFEFVGQREFLDRLLGHGAGNSYIFTRLSVGASYEQNRNTNPFRFYDGDKLIYSQPAAYNPDTVIMPLKDLQHGRGYISRGKLIEQPMDFSDKNYFGLDDQHYLLMQLFFPESFESGNPLNLTDDDYRFLYRVMSMLPRESKYPKYEPYEEYWDGYVKFFMYGDTKDSIPSHIRIFNKVGLAYGYLTDNAYIIDTKNNIEFFLSATIYVNEDGIFNDDKYEYDSIGFPFLARLGRYIYEYELKRKKDFLPDFSKFLVK